MDIQRRLGLNSRHEISLEPLCEGSQLPQVVGPDLSGLVISRLHLLRALRKEEHTGFLVVGADYLYHGGVWRFLSGKPRWASDSNCLIARHDSLSYSDDHSVVRLQTHCQP